MSYEGGTPRFLVVRDRRHHDWTFVTGGCQNKKEISRPLLCALRELKEETKGIVDVTSGKYSSFFFKTDKVTPNFIFIYHVIIIELPITPEEQQFHVNRFQHEMVHPTHLPLKCYNETENMLWVTFEEFKNMNKWIVVKTHLMDNPDFYVLVCSLNRRPFNIVKKQHEQQKQKVYSNPNFHPPGFFPRRRYRLPPMVGQFTEGQRKPTETESGRLITTPPET